jgi:hypothetical protein
LEVERAGSFKGARTQSKKGRKYVEIWRVAAAYQPAKVMLSINEIQWLLDPFDSDTYEVLIGQKGFCSLIAPRSCKIYKDLERFSTLVEIFEYLQRSPKILRGASFSIGQRG